jgi:hypothetical protein
MFASNGRLQDTDVGEFMTKLSLWNWMKLFEPVRTNFIVQLRQPPTEKRTISSKTAISAAKTTVEKDEVYFRF